MANGIIDFSDEDRDNVDNITTDDIVDPEQVTDGEDEVSGEELVRRAFEQIHSEDDVEDEEPDQEPEEQVESEDEPEQQESSQEFKNAENAANAERRRQAEQQRLEEYRRQTPEAIIISQLSELYGKTPEEMLAQLQEATIVHKAQQEKVPVEYMRQQQQLASEIEQLRNQAALQEFQAWDGRISQEADSLKSSYPFLNDDDIAQAKDLILNTWKNVDIPLEQAVFALHGKKITEKQLEASRNEVLAEVSGRKSTSVIPPKSGKADDRATLTDDEKYIARQMGVSEADYLKYK